MAYCLLGIFDIDMPMIYSEGYRAFAKLQEEIMKASDDTTLLAWGYKFPWYGSIEADSFLVSSPASFTN
jgi:outer membrane protein assembly factor BamB